MNAKAGRMSRISWPLLLSLLTLSAPCLAGGSPRAHDGGFLLRLSAGAGYGSSSLDALEVSGLSGDINFAIGGIVSPNLALHGTLFGWTVSDPDVELGSLGAQIRGDFTLSAIGGGLTYYLDPSNLYLSGSIGVGQLSFEGSDSDAGVVLDATLGKEWWVGDSWGLGIAGALGIHSIPDGGVDESWSGVSFGVRFSATLN